MSNLSARIKQLDEDKAVRLVTLLADIEEVSINPNLTSEYRIALQNTLDTDPPPSSEAGDLARKMLQLQVQDEESRDRIAQLIEGPIPEQFLDGTTIALSTAVLILLQTRVRFERDSDGNWSVVVEKGASSNKLLQEVIQHLVGLGED
ncbi:hypothetical protein [Salinibacter sp.]|uniref:hypothetical protein n=1 Tax=Salinibacter sp. TaxID=2065818 RepID=UPI0021E6EEB6|nr:hypothetical protein [Salinibacter sp.]